MGVQCEVCGKRLRTRYNLNIHMAVHTGAKPYTCSICCKGFQQKWNLITHKSRVHDREKPFKCQDCGRTFGYASHFKAHVKVHFLQQLKVPDSVKAQILHPFACTKCTRRFESSRLLDEHSSVHTGEKPFTCNTCGKNFASRKHIVKHFQRRCNESGTQGKVLSYKLERTPCQICGKIVARYSMPKHLNIHTRKRTYPCQFCPRVFLESGQLSVHTRTHSGLKPHICEVCGRAHAQLGNLMSHRRRHHGLTDKPARTMKQQEYQINITRCNEPVSASNESLTNDIPEDRLINENSTNVESDMNCTGNETIKDFLQIAEQWITDRLEKSKAVRKSNEHLQSITVDESISVIVPQEKISFHVKEVEAVNPEEINEVEKTMSYNTRENILNNAVEEAREASKAVHKTGEQQEPNVMGESPSINILNEEDISYGTDEEKASNLEEVDEVEKTTKTKGYDAKEEIVERIIEEIGEKPKVKPLLLKAQKKKKRDVLLWILRRLGDDLPPNRVVERTMDGSYLWRCWDCPVTLKARPLLIRHRLVHVPPHLRPHSCETCGRTFTQAGNLKHHILVHRREHRFFCEICGTGFRHNSHFKTHKKRHEDPTPSQRRFQCETCGKACLAAHHLAEHIRTHTKERPYLCRTCGRQFAASSTYTRHLKRHNGEKEACAVCGKLFTDSSSRRRHQAAHNARPLYTCVCGSTFPQKASLLRHAPICPKAPEPAQRSHQCLVCLKGFLTASGLKRHSTSHDSTRRFFCKICKNFLKSPETLRRHLLRHDTSM